MHQTTMGGGGHRTEKTNTGRGDTTHTFLMEGAIGVGRKHKLRGVDTAHTLLMGEQFWVGTPQHNIERTS